MTTVPEPLSAELITMSLRLPRSFQACRSRAVKLSRTGANVRGLVAFGTEWVWDWFEEDGHQSIRGVSYVG